MLWRVWDSSTATTWASNLSRSLGLLLILPLVLRRFSAEEFNIWMLFSIFLSLQALLDLGFGFTLVRALSAALAGASNLREFSREARVLVGKEPNWKMVARIIGGMRLIYNRLALAYLGLLLLAGTLLMMRPINQADEPAGIWLAWGLVVGSGYFSFRATYLGLLLQGLNKIALFRRWEAMTTLGGVLSGCLILLFGGNLLSLVVVTQFWAVVGVFRNMWLCRAVVRPHLDSMPKAGPDREMLETLWPAAWRTGLGAVASLGLIQSTGIIQAHVAPVPVAASYLLCLRLFQLLGILSQAPFYSKLPFMSQLRAKGESQELLRVAARGMNYSLWTFALGFGLAGTLGDWFLQQLHSNVSFPSAELWTLLGTMFFVERYGAMHLNLYSTTNHIINHAVNGVTAAVSLGVGLALVRTCGSLAIPIGLLSGYLAFYSWYPALRSYREFRMPFLHFERHTTFWPLLFFLIVAVPLLLLR